MRNNTIFRDAIRILFLLRAGGQQFVDNIDSNIVSIFRGETRLHAFDFWMRNPDYLAAELLDLYKQNKEIFYLKTVEKIFDEEEPDFRRIPMVRYLFGAYERLDNALSVLRVRDLIQISGKKSRQKTIETDFLLTKYGKTVCETACMQFPELTWYANRASLISTIAGNLGGAALKEKQYRRASYAETELGGVIPSISDKVKKELELIKQFI